MLFHNIPGNQEIKSKLINTVRVRRVPQGQMFIGPEGNCSLPLALAFARYVLCTDHHSEDSCGKCTSCNMMSKLIHPDLHFIFPMGRINRLKNKDLVSNSLLPEWRNFLMETPYGILKQWNESLDNEVKQFNISKEESRQIIKNVSLKTHFGGYKVFIIWLPEYMNKYTANALLKILEEPPPRTIFILVSHNIDSIPNTIISRLRSINIGLLDTETMSSYLQRHHSVDHQESQQIATMSNGNINTALQLIDSGDKSSIFEEYKEWMRALYMNDYDKMVIYSEAFSKDTRQGQKGYIEYSIDMFRYILFSWYELDRFSSISQEEMIFNSKMSKVISRGMAQEVLRVLDKSILYLDRNANAKILFTNLSIHISSLFQESKVTK